MLSNCLPLFNSFLGAKQSICVALAVVALLLLNQTATAQDDIFGFGGSDDTIVEDNFLSADNSSPVTASSNGLPPTSNPIVLEIRRSPPTTPRSYAQTFLYLTRIQEYAELKRYLAEFGPTNITPEIGETMRRAIGTSELIKLKRIPDLTPEESAVIESVLESIGTFQRDQQRLEKSYQQLYSDAPDTQKQGVITLQSAASFGIEYVINQMLSDDRRNPSPAVSYFLSRGGASARQAVAVAFANATARQQSRLALAMAPIRTNEYVDQLTGFVLTQNKVNTSDGLIESAIASATSSLARHGISPDRESFRIKLSHQLERKLESYRTARQTEFPLTVEYWSSINGTDIRSDLGTEIDQRLVECRLIASSIEALATIDDDIAAAAIATLLEYEYITSQTAIVAQPMEAILELPRGAKIDTRFAGRIWSIAQREKLYGAQLRIAQHLGQLSLLQSGPEIRAPLRESLTSPIPIVRLLAALPAISASNRKNQYTQSLIDARAKEMASLSAGPTALIIGNDDFLRNSLQSNLERGGIDSIDAKTARETITVLRKRPTIDFIAFVDRVGDMSLFQLAQRIQNSRFYSSAPMVFLATELSSAELTLIDQRHDITLGSNPPDLAGTIEIVRKIERSTNIPQLTAADRIALREVATEYLQPERSSTAGSSGR